MKVSNEGEPSRCVQKGGGIVPAIAAVYDRWRVGAWLARAAVIDRRYSRRSRRWRSLRMFEP